MEMPALQITQHARERAKKRMGLNAKALERMACKAFTEGIGYDETKGMLRRYIDGRNLEHGTADNVRIYGLHVFIFCGQSLVTVLYLPKTLHKLAAICAAKPNHK